MRLDDTSEAQKEEFMFEIAQMKLLGFHPNVVSLVGCCTLQEKKFLVIEYVPFGDLLQWLRNRRRMVGNVIHITKNWKRSYGRMDCVSEEDY